MEVIILLSLVMVPLVFLADPAPGLLHDRRDAHRLECERLTVAAGVREYPGQLSPPAPRGDYIDRSVLLCREHLLRPGLRAPQDEAILSELEARATELAQAAGALGAELGDRTWLVEAYYPSTVVAAKLSFATKNALMGQGLRVSDRTPTLAAGDISVLTRMAPEDAYPAACQRYAALGSLGEEDALLAVISRDPRETILHAGVCSRGQWVWLR